MRYDDNSCNTTQLGPGRVFAYSATDESLKNKTKHVNHLISCENKALASRTPHNSLTFLPDYILKLTCIPTRIIKAAFYISFIVILYWLHNMFMLTCSCT